MDFNLTDEQRMLQDSARRYMEKNYVSLTREEFVKQGGFSKAVWQDFAEMGWLAASIPEEFGGIGFGLVETAILAEELGRGLLLEPYLHACLFPAAVIRYCGSEQWKSELLPQIGAGEKLVAVAHSEPESRGDVAWVATRAERTEDGFVLNGRKSVVVCAPDSDGIIVSARCAGENGDRDGISLFFVALDAPGLSVQTISLLDGTPAVEIELNQVRVEHDALLGAEGTAYAGLQQAVNEAIVYQCGEMVGGMEDVLALCSEYLKTRKQFGVAIGSFQALQHRMADMAIDTMQARASLHRALAIFAAVEPGDVTAGISGCKAQVIRSAKFVTAQGIQLHGGFGITEEYRVGRHYRRLVLNNAWFGSREDHLARYAQLIRQSVVAEAV